MTQPTYLQHRQLTGFLHEGGPLKVLIAPANPPDNRKGPKHAPAPARDVEALEDKHLAEIIELERAAEPPDLLRKNGEQE